MTHQRNPKELPAHHEATLSHPSIKYCKPCGLVPGKHDEWRLRRCGGCYKTLFCSKECQKASWSKHKCVQCFVSLSFMSVLILQAEQIAAPARQRSG